MAQTFFSTALGPGATSRSFILPPGALVMTVARDLGRRLADGSAEVDLPATVTLWQLSNDGSTYNTLTSINTVGSVGCMADPGNGICQITNSGPGTVACASIAEYER